MTAGPGDDMAVAGGQGHGHLRASRADRERVIDALKAAFVEERLTKDELDVRVGQAYTSRTYAELAALTADLPAEAAGVAGAPLTGAPPSRQPARTPAERPPVGPVKKAVLIGAGLTFQPALLVLAIFIGNDGFGNIVGISMSVYFIFVTIAGLGMIGSWQERSSGRRPPRPVQPIEARKLDGEPGEPGEPGEHGDHGDDMIMAETSPRPRPRPAPGRAVTRRSPGIVPA